MTENIQFPDSIRKQAGDHALAMYPQEACGLVVATDSGPRYLPCRNVAPSPETGFILDPEQFAEAEDVGAVCALFHSHPGGRAKPSMADLVMCERSGIPTWIIVSLGMQADGTIGLDSWHTFGPSGYVAPLLGREFVHGVHDCYALIRDWYEQERGITLPDFERNERWWETKGASLYLDNYRAAGFIDVGRDAEPQAGDVLLMTVLSKHGEPNHAGVYLGGGQFLHHTANRLSGRALFGGMWSNSLFTVLRYGGLNGGGNTPND